MTGAPTPGPWEVYTEASPRGPKMMVRQASTGYPVAHALTLGAQARSPANARLIAATPDLLEVVQVFLAHYPGGINPFLDGARTLGREAIAKALPSPPEPKARELKDEAL
jgi:hypothetical protein